MRNLIYLIIRYSALILFLILEITSFVLIIKYNKSQNEIWAHSSSLLSGSVFNRIDKVNDFFKLSETNDSLLLENARLLETIINYRINTLDNSFQEFEQSDAPIEFGLIPARICNKTINLRNNFITLTKGTKDSIEVGMGVISQFGIVGIVSQVSENFSTVQLILNSQSRISAKVTSKNNPGNLVWDSEDPNILTLLEIPKHAEIAVGDSISTSGFSTCFPPDIHIGKIIEYSLLSGSNNYRILVQLHHDILTLEQVFVVNYLKKEEKEEHIKIENE